MFRCMFAASLRLTVLAYLALAAWTAPALGRPMSDAYPLRGIGYRISAGD